MAYEEIIQTALPMVVGSLGLYVTFYLLHRKKRPLEYVGTVTELYLHPVKSGRGIQVEEAECTWKGFKWNDVHDRQFLVCDPSDRNSLVNIKRFCKMTLLVCDVQQDCDSVAISFPGMEDLNLPKELKTDGSNLRICHNWNIEFKTIDCGDMAADWINKALESNGLRLVYSLTGMEERAREFFRHDGTIKMDGSQFTLPEQSTVNLLSKPSLDKLNNKINNGSGTASVRHFRPNIVVDGCEPNEEDSWEEIVINKVSFFQFDLAERCMITTVNPSKPEPGHIKKEPLATLITYRKMEGKNGPIFGVRLGLINTGSIKVGDKVYARKKF